MGDKDTAAAATSKSGGKSSKRQTKVSPDDTNAKTFVTQDQLMDAIQRIMDHTADAVQQAKRAAYDQGSQGVHTCGVQSPMAPTPTSDSTAVRLARLIEQDLAEIQDAQRELEHLKTAIHHTERRLSSARLNHLNRQREFDSAVRERVLC